MLKHLAIENFALVDRLEIDFKPGLNVLTGETGAGKSIIVGAIAQLLGEKADKDDIRSGTKLAVIEGEFDLSGNDTIKRILDSLQIEYEESIIILRREIPENRASRSFINGRMVPLVQLREITAHLAELFGQHSHQQLLDEKNHLLFLDRYAGLTHPIEALQDVYHGWQGVKRDLAGLEARRDTERNERELLLFQKEEIEKARIRAGEEEELLAERKILDSSQVLGEKSNLILSLLDGDDSTALSILNTCRRELTTMAGLDKSLEKKAEMLDQAIINLEELRSEIEAYLSDIPDDPERLEAINLRLDEIYRLKKKYGGSEEAILTTLTRINEQLMVKIDVDDRLRILGTEEKDLRHKYCRQAGEISAERRKAAADLAARVGQELELVGMEAARFEFEFDYESDPDGIEFEKRKLKPGPLGWETGRFLISANPGEPFKPLARTASGGEISRIMLAIKAADKKYYKEFRPLMVFDEIDAGIGGQTANLVAGRLAAAAREAQLLVITHLHQIAGLADHHFAVEKTDSKGRSGRKIISIRELNKPERRKEIDRMISLPNGINISID
nr:DNA repair protein RecN [candidate division Zixibacteria bacterium]